MRRLAALVLATLMAAAVAAPSVASDNHPPVAVDDPAVPGCNVSGGWGGSYPVPEDVTQEIPGLEPGWFGAIGACSPLANDFDPDGDPLTLTLEGQPAHGDALWVDGLFFYRPDPDFNTLAGDQPGGSWISDEVRYRVSDGQATSDVASYRFWVAPINDPPSFTPGAGHVEATMGVGPFSIPWATDISAGPANEARQTVSFDVTHLDVTGVPDMFSEIPTIDGDGVLHFTPGSEPGLAHVTVRARDDGGLEDYGMPAGFMIPPDDTSDEVTFDIVVWPPAPAAPIAVDDELVLDEDTSGGLGPLDNDSDVNGDPLSLLAVGPATRGVAEIVSTTRVVYTPDPDAHGTDAFTYTVDDGTDRTATGTVHVTINPINDDPVAHDDAATTGEATAIVVPVLANDDDVDGDTLRVGSIGTPAHGTASIEVGGVRYVPAPGFLGSDQVSYTVTDGAGGIASAVLRLTVVADAVAPVIASVNRGLPAQALHGATVAVKLTWSATDSGSGVASYQLQERIGAGSWHTVRLASPSAQSVIRATTIGKTYRYRVRATDHRGNASAWKAWTQFSPRRAQETSSNIRWSGTWSTVHNSRLSGGAARRTSSSGRRATYTFAGRDIGWVTMRSTVGGHAEVWIDGVLVRTIDVDSSATGFRRMRFTSHLATGGTHRIEIRPKGDGRVTIDAFVVLP